LSTGTLFSNQNVALNVRRQGKRRRICISKNFY